MSISFIKLLSVSMCLRKSILVFMSLVFCNDAPISPLNALMAVHFLAFTVYLKALFSSVCKSEICFFFVKQTISVHVSNA